MPKQKKRPAPQHAAIPPKKSPALSPALASDAPKRKRRLILVICLSLLLSGLIISGILLYSNEGFRNNHTTALKVDGVKISVAEYNFYYMSYLNTFYSNNSDNLSYLGLDPSTSLKDQMMDETTSWVDYLHTQTQEYILQLVSLSKLAEQENRTLSDNSLDAIEDYLDSIAEYAQSNGLTEKEFIQKTYGVGVTKQLIEKAMTRFYLADEYRQFKASEKQITEEDIESYYNENADTFHSVDLRMFFFAAQLASDNPTEEERAAAMEEAGTLATQMLAEVTDEASFQPAAEKYSPYPQGTIDFSDPGSTLAESIYPQSLGKSNEATDWIFSPTRKAGDKTALEFTDGWYVLYIISPPGRAEHTTVHLRNILIQQDNTGEETASLTDADREAIKEKAENVLMLFESGEKTSDAFAQLAASYSYDTSTYANGGLIENAMKENLPKPVREWAYDASRKQGDYALLESSDGSYQLVYFEGKGSPVWKLQVQSSILNDEMNRVIQEAVGDHAVEVSDRGYQKAKDQVLKLL